MMIIDDIERYGATMALIQSYDLQIESLLNPYHSPQWGQVAAHGGSDSSATERAIAKRAELIKARGELIARNERVEEYVRQLEQNDIVVATIIRLRFINCLKWRDVAVKYCGNAEAENSVWMTYYRFKCKQVGNVGSK